MLKQRLLFGALLTVVLGGVFYLDYVTKSSWGFFGLMAVIMLFSLYEFYDMHEKVVGTMNKTIALISIGLLLSSISVLMADCLPPSVGKYGGIVPVLIFMLLVIYPFVLPVLSGKPQIVGQGYVFIISIIYLVIPLIICFVLYTNNRGPQLLLIYLIGLNKLSDSAAYFGGRTIGGKLFGNHKLAPNISPNKTIEGFICAILCGVPLTFLAAYFGLFNGFLPHLFWVVAFFGLVVTLFGQMGDLVESAIKRYCGVKDSGRWLPGLGGVLDLIDSIIFSAPIMIILLALFRPPILD